MKRNSKSEMNKDKQSYYQPSPKMRCEICDTVYFSGHGKRHVNSKRHNDALQLFSKFMNKPVVAPTAVQ